MRFENQTGLPDKIPKASLLAESFKKLPDDFGKEPAVFENLEEILSDNSFMLAHAENVFEVFNNNALKCRSESFSKVIDVLDREEIISLENTDNHANMCIMASGEGFRIAMMEGFGGKDVGNIVKTVIVFDGEHLETNEPISPENEMWNTKPKTAQVSLAGSGEITREDIKMISFRFPIKYFPSSHLSDSERELLEDQKIEFIVRHYIPNEITDKTKPVH